MMTNKLSSLLLIVMGIFWVSLTYAQESVNSSGGDVKGSGGTIAYSVGQLISVDNSGDNGSVSPGIQQAYEIFAVGINESMLNISLTVFPNPTADNLTLQIREFDSQKLHYKIYNLEGELLKNSVVTASHTTIDMTALPSGTYFIEVVDNENRKIQTFKIIKN